MLKNKGNVSETLSEIIGVAIEYDLHLEPNQFINYMDLYCRYLQTRCHNVKGIVQGKVNFYHFICNQSLLDTAASATENETGEAMVAPKALQPRHTLAANFNLIEPDGLH